MIRETIEWVKGAYATPSAETLALRELEDSKRLTAYLHNATEAA